MLLWPRCCCGIPHAPLLLDPVASNGSAGPGGARVLHTRPAHRAALSHAAQHGSLACSTAQHDTVQYAACAVQPLAAAQPPQGVIGRQSAFAALRAAGVTACHRVAAAGSMRSVA